MTIQIPDKITYEGEKLVLLYQGNRMPLLTEPMLTYDGPKPTNFLSLLVGVPMMSCNWRGYISEWEIIDDALYLVGASGAKAAVNTEFIKVNGIIKASWFSGELHIGKGKGVLKGLFSNEVIYEHEIFLTIEKGCVTKARLIDN